jgi:hypothetical protein
VTPTLNFVVGPASTGATSSQVDGATSDGSVTGISIISIGGGSVSTFSETELSYTAQAYYNAYMEYFLWDNDVDVQANYQQGGGTVEGTLQASTNPWDDYDLKTDHWVQAVLCG